MAVVLVHSQVDVAGSGYILMPSVAPTVGNMMIVSAAIRASGGGPNTISGWTLVTPPGVMSSSNAGNTRDYALFYRVVQIGDTSWSPAVNTATISYAEFSGVGAFLSAVSTTQNSNTVCGGAITTSDAAFIFGGVCGNLINDTGSMATAPTAPNVEVSDSNGVAGAPGYWTAYREEAAAGTFTVGGIITSGGGATIVQAGVTAAFSLGAGSGGTGGHVEWDGIDFTDESDRIREWTITRGAPPELTGGSQPGQATIVMVNAPDDRYNPENAGGDLYGTLHDGPRVWIGVNEDGTITPDVDKVVYGLFAGRITELSVLPEGGAVVAPFAEIVCEDPLGWLGRRPVTLADSTTRSQYDLRLDVLTEAGETAADLAVEPTTLPLSSASGVALGILDDINRANGTRHFARPQNNTVDWYKYTTVRRTERLDGTSDASLSASSQHVTGTDGWRTSADGVINQQKATVEPISFPGRVHVWQPDLVPFTVTGELVIWADFGDYVGDPEYDVDYTGSALTVALEPFGDTAKLTLTSAGTSAVQVLNLFGHLVQRGSVESVVIDDLTSQAEPRGIRAGADLSGDYLGTLTSAKGFAEHIVWRFGNPLYRPTMTVENWIPTQFALDMFDRIAFTSSQLGVSARIFEIVGLTHHGLVAALAADDVTPVVYHTTTYVLQESRVQEPFGWFILDDSLLDGTDVLAY